LARKNGAAKQVRVLDPKRKLWYEKRLREQAEQAKENDMAGVGAMAEAPAVLHTPSLTRAAASRAGGSLLESLASAKEVKGKNGATKGRAEAWRRKPGDPIF
jgi:hypothetical protein